MKAKDNYQPFGDEWKKEVKRMTKDDIIELLKASLIRNSEQLAEISDMELEIALDELLNGTTSVAYFIQWLKQKLTTKENDIPTEESTGVCFVPSIGEEV